MSRLSAAPGSGHVRDALADALEDPSLELVFWLPEWRRFVDGGGHEYELPEDDPRARSRMSRASAWPR